MLSFPDFVRQVGPWQEGYKVASLTDLYAVYTVLHIEDKEWAIKWSESAQIYYFIAKQTIEQGVETKASAPEGDEDVPEVGCPVILVAVFLRLKPINYFNRTVNDSCSW